MTAIASPPLPSRIVAGDRPAVLLRPDELAGSAWLTAGLGRTPERTFAEVAERQAADFRELLRAIEVARREELGGLVGLPAEAGAVLGNTLAVFASPQADLGLPRPLAEAVAAVQALPPEELARRQQARRERFALRRALRGRLYREVKGYAIASGLALPADATDEEARRFLQEHGAEAEHWGKRLPPAVRVEHRVSGCGLRPNGDESPRLRIAEPAAGARRPREAGYAGLMTCGHLWACPVCQAKIMAGRVQELRELLDRHLGDETGRARYEAAVARFEREHGRRPTPAELGPEAGWTRPDRDVSFVTLTIPHSWGDSLERNRRVVRDGLRALLAGAPGKRLRARFAIAGQVSDLDLTHGPNGWHPHLHVLVLHDRRLRPADRDALELALLERWRAYLCRSLTAVDQETGEVRPAFNPAELRAGLTVHVRTGNRGAADYIGKLEIAYELASPGTKRARRARHRTPWQILADYARTGAAADWELFLEYVRGMYRAKRLTWSRGLKRRYAIGERSDEELAALVTVSEATGDPVDVHTALVVERDVWARLQRLPGADVAVLDAAERGGASAAALLLGELVELDYLRERAHLAVPDDWAELWLPEEVPRE